MLGQKAPLLTLGLHGTYLAHGLGEFSLQNRREVGALLSVLMVSARATCRVQGFGFRGGSKSMLKGPLTGDLRPQDLLRYAKNTRRPELGLCPTV
jgi:hypothetical protein